MPRNYFSSGQWNFYCDVCGRKLKSGEGRKRWDGYMVCSDDYETRHPQDFLRTKPDRQSVPWSRPKTPDIFIPINFTEHPTDIIGIDETVTTSTDFYRYVGQIIFPTNLDVVNGGQVNLLAINTNSIDDPAPTNNETITFSELLSVSVGQNIFVTDSISFSETLFEVEGESLSDSFGFSESVTAFTITNKLINAHKLNEVTLG